MCKLRHQGYFPFFRFVGGPACIQCIFNLKKRSSSKLVFVSINWSKNAPACFGCFLALTTHNLYLWSTGLDMLSFLLVFLTISFFFPVSAPYIRASAFWLWPPGGRRAGFQTRRLHPSPGQLWPQLVERRLPRPNGHVPSQLRHTRQSEHVKKEREKNSDQHNSNHHRHLYHHCSRSHPPPPAIQPATDPSPLWAIPWWQKKKEEQEDCK